MIRCWSCGIALLLGAISLAEDDAVVPLARQKAELAKIQAIVGTWKGVGQPQRGSTKGAWTEESEWKWRFKEEAAELVFDSPKGRYFTSGSLRYVGGEKPWVLSVVNGGNSSTYVGTLNDDKTLTLQADKPLESAPERLTLRLAAGSDRLIVLLEKKAGAAFTRLAEVGATRKGSGFGKGTTYIECIVTGGLGTIEVTHEGETYHVCCTGCLEVFKEDPAGTVKDYLARKEEEKSKKD